MQRNVPRHQIVMFEHRTVIVDLEGSEKYQKVASFVTGTRDGRAQKVHYTNN